MLHIESQPQITFITGGSGGVPLVNASLNHPFKVTSITGVIDDGGHSGELRSILGVLPPGDATHQIAVHIRDPYTRELFTLRWIINGDTLLNGHRPGNDFLSAAEKITGSHSKGIKFLEHAFRADYKGRVIPISDDNVQLRINLVDGSYKDGEHQIDQMTVDDPPIKDLTFLPNTPNPNPEALEHIANADLIVIPPGTLWGSILPILATPGVQEALRYSKAPIAWFCNAVTTPETHKYKTADFAKRLVDYLGRPIDLAFINKLNHTLPDTYAKEAQYPVEDNLKEGKLVTKIFRSSLTHLEYSGGKWVIRHNGEKSIQALLKVISL